MKIFVLGSTGVIGKNLIPLLVDRKNEVSALVRSSGKVKVVEDMGAKAVIADVFNKEALARVIKKAEPEVIIHQLTALATFTGNFKKFDKEFELTNRFRTEVADTLLNLAKDIGTKRVIVQSFCGWPFARVGGPLKTEEDPLDTKPPSSFTRSLEAIKHLEKAVKESEKVEALALRYGFFYGPGTSIAKDSSMVELIRRNRLPVVGNGAGIWSFLHIRDAARATVAALTNGSPGIYNVVDDEPARVSEWLPFLAKVLGVKPPSKVPVWLAKILIGEGGVSMMTKIRGASNAKAKNELKWEPIYPSWRQGFAEGL
jgi:nucleoside-diphosphate-sugar epimerase